MNEPSSVSHPNSETSRVGSPARRPYRDARIDALATPGEVIEHLDNHRRRRRRMLLAASMLAIVASIVASVLIVAMIDFTIPLLPMARWTLATGLSVVWIIAIAYRMVPMIASGCSRLGIARRMENTHPLLGQSLRTLVSRQNDSDVLTRLLATRTDAALTKIEPDRHPQNRPLKIAAASAVLAVAAMGLWSIARWDTRLSIARIVSDGDAYTRVHVTPGDPTVIRGTAIKLALNVDGRQFGPVDLATRPIDSDAQWVSVKLSEIDRDAQLNNASSGGRPQKRFVFAIDSAKDSFEYRYTLGRHRLRPRRVTVVPPVQVVASSCRIVPPAYTGLAIRNHEFDGNGMGNLTVAEGSKVQWEWQTTSPLRTVRLHLGDQTFDGDSVSNDRLTINGDRVRFSWTAERDVHLSVEGIDGAGIPLRRTSGEIRVRADAAPKIRWVSPAAETRVTSIDEVPMAVQISDDYGLIEGGIIFDVGDATDNVLIDFVTSDSAPGALPKARRLEESLPLEYFELTQRNFVAYHAFAVDNHPDAPRRTETPIRYIDIRPLRQNIREVRLTPEQVEQLQRVRLRLNEAINSQRRLIQRTMAIESWSPAKVRASWRSMERHIQSQSNLADGVRELAEGRLAAGNDDNDSLASAEASMIAAVDSMETGNMPVAKTQQDDAHRSLIEARNEIDIRLAAAAPMQLRREVLRRLRQRLRRQRDNRNQQQQSLADQLRALAGTQRTLRTRLSTDASSTSPADPADAQNDAFEDRMDAARGDQDAAIQTAGILQTAIAGLDWPSDLVPRRMDAAVDQMGRSRNDLDRLGAGDADGQDATESLAERLDKTAAMLDELAFELQTLASEDPGDRLREMAESFDRVADAIEATMSADQGNRSRNDGFIERRSETLRDLLTATDGGEGDVVMREQVAEVIDEILDAMPVMTALDQTASGQMPPEPSEPSGNASRRDTDAASETPEVPPSPSTPQTVRNSLGGMQAEDVFRRVADQMMAGYRSIRSPRLERLRKLEREAAELAAALSPKASESGEPSDASERVEATDVEPFVDNAIGDNAIDTEPRDQSGGGSPDDDDETLRERAAGLGERLEQQGFGGNADQIAEAIAGAVGGDPYKLRDAILAARRRVAERIAELLRRQFEAGAETPVPPGYDRVVEDYYRQLIRP